MLLFAFIFSILAAHSVVSGASVTVSSCSDLNKAIERVNRGEKVGEILIRKGATIKMTSSCKGITKIIKNLSITGQGSPAPKITGDNRYPIFYVNAGRVRLTLKNLIITSGKGDNGGCVRIPKFSSGVFTNVVFQNCIATKGNGGAIYSDGNVNLTFVIFDQTSCGKNGGAIWSSSTLNIKNSKFTNNSALNGGAIYSKSRLDIEKSTFIENSVTNYYVTTGGSLCAFGTTTISNCTFKKNSVISYDQPAFGGAIYSQSSLNISNSNFFENSVYAPSDSAKGGAIYSVSKLNVEKTIFTENSANSIYESYGGAIYSLSAFNFSSSTFTNNSAYTSSDDITRGDVYIDA